MRELGLLLQQRGEPGMQPGVPTGQHVLVHDLAQQGVPEQVAVLVDDQDAHVDRLAQIGVQLRRRSVADRLQQRVLHPGAGHGGDLQGLLRAIGQALDPDVQCVAQGVGHVHAAT